MKKIFLITLAAIAVLGFMLTGCGSGVEYDKTLVEETTTTIIDHFNNDDMQAVYDMMDEGMHGYTEVEDLEAAWLAPHAELGNFVRINGISIHTEDGYVLVVVSVKYDISSVEFQIAYSDTMEITGLYFK